MVANVCSKCGLQYLQGCGGRWSSQKKLLRRNPETSGRLFLVCGSVRVIPLTSCTFLVRENFLRFRDILRVFGLISNMADRRLPTAAGIKPQ